MESSCFTIIVLVSVVQQNESAPHTHVSPPFWISFPFRSPWSAEEGSLCCAGGSHHLPVLHVVADMCQPQSPNSFPLLSPLGVYMFVLYIYVSFCSADRFASLIFLDFTYACQYMILGFLFLTCFILSYSLQAHPHLCK